MVNPSLCWNRNFLVARCRYQMREKDFLMWEVLFILSFLSYCNRGGGWREAGFSAAAAHDEAVRSFGRNDDLFWVVSIYRTTWA